MKLAFRGPLVRHTLLLSRIPLHSHISFAPSTSCSVLISKNEPWLILTISETNEVTPPAFGSRFPASRGFQFPAPGPWLPASGPWPPALGYIPGLGSQRLPVPCPRPPAVGSWLPAICSRGSVSGRRLQTPNFLFPAPGSPAFWPGL